MSNHIKTYNEYLITEKTLYHGTIVNNIASIKDNGLLPTIGDFVKTMYAGSVDDNIEDYLEELLYATDKKQLNKAVTAIIYHIANKLNKSYHSVTNDDFERYAALAVIKNGDEFFNHNTEDNEYLNYIPIGVEQNDYYTNDIITPDYILTGKKLLAFLKKYDLFPIKNPNN